MWSDERLARAYRTATTPSSRERCPATESVAVAAISGNVTAAMAGHFGDCAACAEEFALVRRAAPSSARRATPIPRWALAASLLVGAVLGAVPFALIRLGGPAEEPAPMPSARSAPLREIVEVPTPTPSANVAIIDLLPPSALTRGGSAPDPAVVPPGIEGITLILILEGRAIWTGYEIEIRREQGEVLWRSSALRPSPDETFNVHLPRSLTPPGTYAVVLSGVRDGERTLVETYRFRVAPP